MNIDAYRPQMLGILRIVSGLLFIEHGTQKLLGFPVGQNPAPALLSLFGIGGVIELVGGLLILIGLFTRPAAFICAGQMAVAYWMFHFPSAFFPAQNSGDAAILFCFVFLYLVFAGAGAFSIDGARRAA